MDSYHAAIHENLRLLAHIFPKLDMESRLQEGMFKKPNTRGMQSVFYSLMMVLNPEYCRQNVPWPISFQSDSYKFRTAVVNFIKTECLDFEAPQLLPSLLNKTEGEKYVRLLFDFVTYVTKTVIKRKANCTLLNVPYADVGEEVRARAFEAISNSVSQRIHNERQSLIENKEFMESSSQLIKESEKEKTKLLKDIKQKKETLFNELQDKLSYTNMNEKNMIQYALSDYETEANESRRNYFLARQDISRTLMKIKHMVQLMKLVQSQEGNLISSEHLRSQITNDLAERIEIPLTTILSTLFENSENGHLINLKEFVRYGYLLLRSLQRRLLNLEKHDQYQIVHQEAKNILNKVTKEANDMKSFREELDKMILDCEQKIPLLESRCEKNTRTNVNEDLVETMQMMLSMENYCPKLSDQCTEEAVLIDVPSVPESNEDIVSKLLEKMKKMAPSKD